MYAHKLNHKIPATEYVYQIALNKF